MFLCLFCSAFLAAFLSTPSGTFLTRFVSTFLSTFMPTLLTTFMATFSAAFLTTFLCLFFFSSTFLTTLCSSFTSTSFTLYRNEKRRKKWWWMNEAYMYDVKTLVLFHAALWNFHFILALIQNREQFAGKVLCHNPKHVRSSFPDLAKELFVIVSSILVFSFFLLNWNGVSNYGYKHEN